MQPGASFRLIMRRGPQPNQQFDLTRDTLTIGRDITNDIVVNDPEVSRHHTRLTRTANGYNVEDLRSTNGTFVNRQRISSPYPLSNGDIVGMGETVTMVYEVAGGTGTADTMANPQPRADIPVAPAPSAAPMPTSLPGVPEDEYDEEEGIDRNRWIVIGCATLTVLFCCTLIGAVIFIDSYQGGVLWCDIPFVSTQLLNCTP